MDRLSERWFKFTDTISTVISSFIFFWVAAFVCFYFIDHTTVHYIDHLSKQTGNDALSTIGALVEFVGYVVSYTLFMIPIGMIIVLIFGNRIGNKKAFILTFPFTFLLTLIIGLIMAIFF
jgi:MFS family permease